MIVVGDPELHGFRGASRDYSPRDRIFGKSLRAQRLRWRAANCGASSPKKISSILIFVVTLNKILIPQL
jgi:hypothetical protein